MTSHLTITEVAERTGLTAHTLRYYERAGLIAPVTRAPGGQRRYAASDMEWIGFLLRLRETRMPIGQMQAFARFRGEGNATVPERWQMLEVHLTDVLAMIESMQRSAGALQDKIAHYRALETRSLPVASPPPERKRSASNPPPTSRPRPLSAGPGQAARNRR
ncbi:putative transcriptional regulator [Acidovorax sp. CF316]|uniref:MerR family transcriptional regulator n=1 Tax=Acidovorax sp. CF316 TaxID=1144317 RepID=UPI00026BEF5A|nr:MerR family transcriptional regulator [Acidovorax sp. CF316]EJE49129.1 putative transcriptional regulator [Acidovorax sp. CF316]